MKSKRKTEATKIVYKVNGYVVEWPKGEVVVSIDFSEFPPPEASKNTQGLTILDNSSEIISDHIHGNNEN